MADSNHTPEQIEILRKCQDLHLRLKSYRSYSLNMGEWDPDHVRQLLAIRREAVETAEAGLAAGIGRGTPLETLINDLDIHPEYPIF